MTDLSIIIPSRNEEFLTNTIDNILENIRGNTEVIAILDGYLPMFPIAQNERVNVVLLEESIGQRAATNLGAKLSSSEFIMKCDAHCAFDEGFDVKLMEDCEYDWTVVPAMYNLHAFDWQCDSCGGRAYQGVKPTKCIACGSNSGKFTKKIIWEAKSNPRSEFYYIDSVDLRFKYWRQFKKRPEAQPDLAPTLGNLGACFFMHRDRFFDLGGMDEEHGSWGQFGTEVSLKAWCSGGKQLTNKKTWFAHMFRTGDGFGFPYKLSGKQVREARRYSNDFWRNNKWPLAVRTLDDVIEQFKPVPTWHDDDGERTVEAKEVTEPKKEKKIKVGETKGLVYYTDNQAEERILLAARNQIERSRNGHALVSVSQYPIKFGKNFVMGLERSSLSMFKQILKGIQEIDADIIFLTEHDVLYNSSHFDFTPKRKDVYYYNNNVWKVDASDGKTLHHNKIKQVSALVAYKSLLLEHYERRVEYIEKNGWRRKIGYEPGKKMRHGGLDDYRYRYFSSEYPIIDIKHPNTKTKGRFNLDEYRCKDSIKDSWEISDSVPFWGVTKGRFSEFLRDVITGDIKIG